MRILPKSSVRLNIPRQLYDDAKPIISQFELTPSGVVKLLFNYIAQEQTIPQELFRKPNVKKQ